MEWNINSGKLIIEWIAKRTPPSCIQVSIILMAMDTNPNSEVTKMIPCIKYIKNMRSCFPCSPSSWQARPLATRFRLSSYTLMQQDTRQQKL